MNPNDFQPYPPAFRRLCESGIAAVLILDRVEDALPLAEALLEGGVSAMELTLRTDAALDGLKAIKQELPEMLIGAGTVLTEAQVAAVVDAGADFAVAPGCNPRTLRAAADHDIPFAPGIATPTDIEHALECGCRLLKYFPAATLGGLTHLQNMAAPFLHLDLRFIPLGGVNEATLPEFARHPLVAAVGGSWLAPKDLMAIRDWKAIRGRAASARAVIDAVR